MTIARRSRIAVALLALAAASTTHAAGGGSCKYKDQSLKFVDGVVYRAPDPFDDTKKQTVIALSTIKLDVDKLSAAKENEMEDAIREQVWDGDGGQLRLTLADDGVTGIYAYIPPGTNVSRSGTAFGDLKLKRNDATGVGGTYGLKPDEPGELDCNATFDLAYIKMKPVAPGQALPAGGGDAGKAYVDYINALRKGDVDGMARVMEKEKADQMLAHRKDADFKDMLGMVQAFSPASVTVKGGTVRGNEAELQVEGKDADGNRVDGTVTMLKDGNAWRLGKEKLTTHAG